VKLAIGIPTRGRPAILGEVLRDLAAQTRSPDDIVVCHATPDDIADLPARYSQVRFITAPAGLPRQRNTILDALPDADAVLFLDDDFLAAPDYLRVTEQVLRAHPDCVVATGTVIADGAKGPGISVEEGRAILAQDHPPADPRATQPHFNGYGCNMALRLAPMRTHALRFDENLPLYGWYEDLDLTRRLGRHGTILRLAGARGVHLGSKSGRVPGRKLGYSQIANTIYLARKGVYPWNRALRSAARNMAMNAARAAFPEPWVDRAGRLRGNLIALGDLVRGKLHPMRVLGL